jgi:hypothetical protein
MIVTKNELDTALKFFKSKASAIDLGFALIYLSKEFKKPETDLLPNLCLEKNNPGINAFYFDKDRKNLYFYSFLWSDNPKAFKDSFQSLIHSGMESIFSTEETDSSFLSEIRGTLYENAEGIHRVFLYFLFNGDAEKAGNSAVLSSLREDLESKKYILDSYFQGKRVSLTVDFVSNENKRKSKFKITDTSFRFELEMKNYLERSNQSNHSLFLGFLKLADLYSIYTRMGQRLFEKNIRSGLSPDNHPNKSIRKSLKSILTGQEDPKNFTFFHNGITISAEHMEINGHKILLTEPRILNGAQTVTSVVKFIEENSSSIDSIEQHPLFQSIEVLGKVILTNPKQDHSDFIANVTINTNRQNPVEPWNLRASDLLQLEFSDKFKEDLGIYYERQENAFEFLTEEDLEEMGIAQNKSIQIKKLAQTFLSLQGELDKIHKLRDIFEDEKKYYNTFKKKYLEAKSESIVLLYKIQFRLGSIVKSVSESTGEKYSDINAKSKNLIWSLLVQGILNDPKLENLQTHFGKNLVMEAEYTEYLKNLGNKKLKPILIEIYKSDKYQKQIALGKFTFLRNKTTYDHSLSLTHDKYGWSKRDLD